ncbi:BNA4 [Symbiodinium sp. CCMP2592]|nr:BNA4 [Symbiodinium sp. CCMP2592]
MLPASDAVLAASPAASAGTLSELGPQDPANFAWACATLGFEEVVPLGGAVEAAMSRASDSSPQNLANAARGFAALLLLGLALVDATGTAGTMHLRPDLCESDVSISLTGIVWAFHFVDLLDEGFYSQVRSFLRARGRQLDANNTGRNWHPATVAEGRSVSSVPEIVVDLPDRFVLFKPPGWEVDTTDAGKGKHLSEFVQDLGCPIFRDAEHGFGLLHRLDTPSSGLILTAKSFEAFYDLKLTDSILFVEDVFNCWLLVSVRGLCVTGKEASIMLKGSHRAEAVRCADDDFCAPVTYIPGDLCNYRVSALDSTLGMLKIMFQRDEGTIRNLISFLPLTMCGKVGLGRATPCGPPKGKRPLKSKASALQLSVLDLLGSLRPWRWHGAVSARFGCSIACRSRRALMLQCGEIQIAPTIWGLEAVAWSLMGMFRRRGQRALAKFGALERVDRWSQTVVGRKDWSGEGEPKVTINKRRFLTKVIARDRLSSCLYEELREMWPDVEVQFSKECTAVDFSTPRPRLSLRNCGAQEAEEGCALAEMGLHQAP